jgi:DNA-binding response OmpR family regulator
VLVRDVPAVHGDEVCRSLAADGYPGALLMLTAAGTLEDRLKGLGIGADDYLPKPFHLAELVARIRALARRSRRPLPPVLVHGDLELDSGRRRVTRSGHQVSLGSKEFAVLELLLGAQGAVFQDVHMHPAPSFARRGRPSKSCGSCLRPISSVWARPSARSPSRRLASGERS